MGIKIPVKAKSPIHSDRAKATLAASIAKDEQAKAVQMQSPLKSRADMKGFAAQHPKAHRLLGVIFTMGRGSSSRRPGVPGCWAAYPYREWSERAKIPDRTLKRLLNVLEAHGLIERVRGHHQGTRVVSYIRPSKLSLNLSDCRPNDYEHFGHKDEPESSLPPAHPSAPAETFSSSASPAQKPGTLAEVLEILGQ